MYRLMLVTATALTMIATAGHSQSVVRSGSTSGAQAIAVIEGGGYGGSSGGTTRNRVINNPDLGSLATVPTAPCIVPTGGSGSGGGIGLSILFGLKDDECQVMRRIEAARILGGDRGLHEGGEIACANLPDYRAMRARVGRPCIADTPVQTAAPLPVAAQAPAMQTAAAKPDWCFTRDPQVLRRAECR